TLLFDHRDANPFGSREIADQILKHGDVAVVTADQHDMVQFEAREAAADVPYQLIQRLSPQRDVARKITRGSAFGERDDRRTDGPGSFGDVERKRIGETIIARRGLRSVLLRRSERNQ